MILEAPGVKREAADVLADPSARKPERHTDLADRLDRAPCELDPLLAT
jgi:hypothetical protein